jgi:hypothetical protein
MFTVFSFIPVANVKAGWPAYLWKKPGYWPATGNQIYWWWLIGIGNTQTIPDDEYSFYRIGWIVSDYEIEAGLDPGPPYQNKLYINGEEIVMQRFVWTVQDEVVVFPDGVERTVHTRAWMWIVRFEPGYFEEGETYEIREVFLVRKPYQVEVSGGLTDSNKWRPYVNYMPGDWQYWYGDVGVINDQITYLHVV